MVAKMSAAELSVVLFRFFFEVSFIEQIHLRCNTECFRNIIPFNLHNNPLGNYITMTIYR